MSWLGRSLEEVRAISDRGSRSRVVVIAAAAAAAIAYSPHNIHSYWSW